MTESPIERPKRRQRQFYSGKKKRHTLKSHCLKIFRILSERYRNRRKRFGLRCNLIAALYNYEQAHSATLV